MKKLITGLLFLSAVCLGTEQTYTHQVFGGIVDEYSADDLKVMNSPDICNVYLDEYNGALVKRTGSIKDNQTLLSNLFVKNLYTYTQQDGTAYKVINTSQTVFTSINGTVTPILSNQFANSRFDFTTAKNLLYGCNGLVVFKSSGTASTLLGVTNSTGVPTSATLMKYVNNRMWFAGMPTTPSQLWYSEINDPDNIQPLNYLLINVSDGDYITGIFFFKGYIIVTKTHSTWQVQETSVGVFSVTNISQNIGCLYPSTFQVYKDYPVWVSNRGVELYDGTFQKISRPLQNTFKNLWQLKTDSKSAGLGQVVFSDWGQGSGVNIDTTTVVGRLGMNITDYNYSNIDLVHKHFIFSGLNDGYRQKIIPEFNIFISTLQFFEYSGGGGSATRYNRYILDGVGNVINQELNTLVDSPMAVNKTLSKNATYYFQAIGLGGSAQHYSVTYSTISYIHNLSTASIEHTSDGTNFTVVMSSYMYFDWYGYTSPATYTTGISTASNFNSWGTFQVNDSQPTNSLISYYVQTSTANDNFTTRPYIPIVNGQTIPTTVGGYAKVTSSFTRTDATANPLINNITLNVNTLQNIYYPIGIIYKDRYYLAMSTDITTQYNNVVYVYDVNGQWTKLSGNWSGAAIYKTQLFTGDSTKGQVYQQDVDGVYTDDGNIYDSYYITKQFDMREIDPTATLLNKTWEELWTRNTSIVGTLDLDYRLDGALDVWTNLYTINLNSSNGVVVQKTVFPVWTKSKFIQLRFRQNSSDTFNMKGFYIPFLPEPRE